ncbi:sulfotransferase family 2 domain-containing protein [Paracoccus sphaerophysae]|uniref:sulfotransferase family 2 domain-containing protein n=1 Tax=Paracoccus sphaerophysae TaxID=690417 RepID=UPI002354B3EF|nr:sulfotransferase family 2 domain-containing protein [Paracoccus sphaerophysae]
MRTVIVHYHIYKNAGTSFDHVLQHNFGDRVELFDGPYPFFTIDQEQLDRIIQRRPAAVAFSSHQVILPAPSSLDYRTLSAIFVRNPFLRIASIYRFKRGPETVDGVPIGLLPAEDRVPALELAGLAPELAYHIDTTATAEAARGHDFAGWVEHCLTTPAEAVHVSNAQTRFFASVHRQRPLIRRSVAGLVYDLAAAFRNLSAIELLGRTEHFETDVARFADILADHGITLALPEDTRKNVTQHHESTISERVEALLAPLPAPLRERLQAANVQDVALYDRACQLIERDHRI